jgi:hypothetical protein
MINEDGSFPKMIEEDLLPCYDQFKPCTFDAKEGYFERCNHHMRLKLRAIRKAGGTLYGPKKVMTAKEIERRRVVAENARLVCEIIKATQLVLDVLGWKSDDLRRQSAEYELSGISLDDAHRSFENDKKLRTLRKCITKLSESIQPYVPGKAQPVIGLLPSGRRKPYVARYGLEGEATEDLMPDPDSKVQIHWQALTKKNPPCFSSFQTFLQNKSNVLHLKLGRIQKIAKFGNVAVSFERMLLLEPSRIYQTQRSNKFLMTCRS